MKSNKDIDILIEIPCGNCIHEDNSNICTECNITNNWNMYESIFKDKIEINTNI